jgi:hypothetical protein
MIMKEARENDGTNRNFNTISPSAKSLLLMKGLTNIPFARQAAESFFKKVGFTIDKEAHPYRSKLSSLKYLIESATREELIK